jgi:hypothetical protein
MRSRIHATKNKTINPIRNIGTAFARKMRMATNTLIKGKRKGKLIE